MLRTDVDEFLELVKREGKIALGKAAKKLNIPERTVQAWIDFLVEEKILGIEYKFTTPFVYMNLDQENKDDINNSMQFETKKRFFENARNRGLNAGQIKLLWMKYINLNKAAMRNAFFEKAKSRNIDSAKAEQLWKKYLEYLESV